MPSDRFLLDLQEVHRDIPWKVLSDKVGRYERENGVALDDPTDEQFNAVSDYLKAAPAATTTPSRNSKSRTTTSSKDPFDSSPSPPMTRPMKSDRTKNPFDSPPAVRTRKTTDSRPTYLKHDSNDPFDSPELTRPRKSNNSLTASRSPFDSPPRRKPTERKQSSIFTQETNQDGELSSRRSLNSSVSDEFPEYSPPRAPRRDISTEGIRSQRMLSAPRGSDSTYSEKPTRQKESISRSTNPLSHRSKYDPEPSKLKQRSDVNKADSLSVSRRSMREANSEEQSPPRTASTRRPTLTSSSQPNRSEKSTTSSFSRDQQTEALTRWDKSMKEMVDEEDYKANLVAVLGKKSVFCLKETDPGQYFDLIAMKSYKRVGDEFLYKDQPVFKVNQEPQRMVQQPYQRPITVFTMV